MEKPSFEELRELAEKQPDAFETLRKELVEELIQSSDASSQRRLRGLQFVIDSRRHAARTPMKALIEIQGMMHESLYRLSQALRLWQGERSHSLSLQPIPVPSRPANYDNIVPFDRTDRGR